MSTCTVYDPDRGRYAATIVERNVLGGSFHKIRTVNGDAREVPAHWVREPHEADCWRGGCDIAPLDVDAKNH